MEDNGRRAVSSAFLFFLSTHHHRPCGFFSFFGRCRLFRDQFVSLFLSVFLSLARAEGGARETPLFSLPLELTIARGSLRLHACRRRPTTPKRSSRTRKRKRVWNTCYSAPVPMMPTRGQKMARTRRRIRWIRSKRRGFC